MSKKEKLLAKLKKRPKPKDFTVSELDTLMLQVGCEIKSGGRGSSVIYYHAPSGRILQFDTPHPRKELMYYHIDKTIKFLKDIGIIDNEEI